MSKEEDRAPANRPSTPLDSFELTRCILAELDHNKRLLQFIVQNINDLDDNQISHILRDMSERLYSIKQKYHLDIA